MKYRILVLLLAAAALGGCYNDNAEDLYPATGTCNTTDVRYSTIIRPIMQQSCAFAGCHATASLAGGYDLSNYAGVKASLDAGRLLGSINHQSGFSPMPKGSTKLADCQINQIAAWVAAGAQDN